MSGFTSRISAILKSFQNRNCLNNYAEKKKEIELKINKFGNKSDSDFCRTCISIKQDILKKNDDLKGCYENNTNILKLIEDTDINNFIKRCNPQLKCRVIGSSTTEKKVKGKVSREEACKQSGSCQKGTVLTRAIGAPKPKPEAESTGKILLKDQIPAVKNPISTGAEELTSDKTIAGSPRTKTPPSNSARASPGINDPKVTNLSGTPGTVDPLTASFPDSIHAANDHLDLGLSTDSSQRSHNGESHSSSTSDSSNLGKNLTKGIQSDNQNLGNKPLHVHVAPEKTFENQDQVDGGAGNIISSSDAPREKSLDKNPAARTADDSSVKDKQPAREVKSNHQLQPQGGNSHDGKLSNQGSQLNQEQGINPEQYQNLEGQSNHDEQFLVRADSKHKGNNNAGETDNNEINSQLEEHTDIFSVVLQYKKYIISGLLPLVILLLLTLLIKVN
ncbi:hypothetical protein PVBG_05983 [Plasmodium vivax Brazil I]|uniref:Variable surface protein Vir18 n=1 Tax=Plasmodium vivax (strain Brazil I) TaxID=1033975 RepID=A0A0J9T439_PLAV1|nr:hypothetical protein PVBG_05983 [Plasmodium vivax Brazil I]